MKTLDGNRWKLSGREPENFTLIVFYRGVHCPVCESYLKTLDGLLDDFEERGTDVVAVSADDRDRAARARREWGLERLTAGFDLGPGAMRDWGLFVSEGIGSDEPERFAEPGLFLVRPDGTLYYVAVSSMTFGRPQLREILSGIDFVLENDDPGRGKA